MPIKRLIFIRPGETDWNLLGRWQGWVASPLNEHGKAQVHRMANFIRNIGLTVIYSSDHRRARDTAEILASYGDYPIIYDPRLRERHIGHWQGLTVPEIHGWYSDEYMQLLADPEGYKIPNGESLNDVKGRSMAALEEIISKEETKDFTSSVGIITHTTALRTMLPHLIPALDLRRQTFGNTSVTTVLNQDGEWKLAAINDLLHLEGLESRYMPEVQGDDQ